MQDRIFLLIRNHTSSFPAHCFVSRAITVHRRLASPQSSALCPSALRNFVALLLVCPVPCAPCYFFSLTNTSTGLSVSLRLAASFSSSFFFSGYLGIEFLKISEETCSFSFITSIHPTIV